MINIHPTRSIKITSSQVANDSLFGLKFIRYSIVGMPYILTPLIITGAHEPICIGSTMKDNSHNKYQALPPSCPTTAKNLTIH